MIRAFINGVMLVVSATMLVAQAPTRYDRAGETTCAGTSPPSSPFRRRTAASVFISI